MKLKSILKILSVDQLRGIQDHWDIAPADIKSNEPVDVVKSHLISNLYQRLQTRNAWEHATRNLTESQWKLIYFLSIHGGDVERSELCDRFFKGDELEMESLVGQLAQLGIAFFDNVPGLSEELVLCGIPEPFLRFIELPSYWEGYLGHFLKELSNNELKHIATQGLKLNLESANKNYLIYLIRTNLLKPKFLKSYIERLTDAQRAVFDSLVDRRGVCVFRDLLQLNVQHSYDHSRGDALQWLLNTGGLIFTAVPGGNKYNNLLMVPRDVMYVISNHFAPDRRTFEELESISVVEKEQKPSVILENANTLLRDLVVLANFINNNHIRVLTNGGVSKTDLKRMVPLVSRFKTTKYVDFLVLFLIEKKYLRSTGENYRVSSEFLEWLANSQNAYQDLLSWWLKTSSWNEEFTEGNMQFSENPPVGLVASVTFRQVILEVLAEMPTDRWCTAEGFYEEVIPKIEQEIPRRGDNLKFDRYTRSNELVTESILAEPLRWLGILAIGLKDDKDVEIIGCRQGDGKTLKAKGGSRGRPRKQPQPEYTFRFTDLGRFIISRPLDKWNELFSPNDEHEVLPINFDVDSFIVQPTHEIIVPPDLQLPTFYKLNEIAHVKSIDVMSLLYMDKTSIRQALDHGWDAEDIITFLTETSRTPVPDSLKYLVQECAEKHGQVNMGHAGGFLVVDDENMLNQMRTNKKIAASIKTVIDNKVVLLNVDTDVKRLAREMQKIGFMPHLESEHVTVGDDTFTLSLSKDDMTRVIAAVKYVLSLKDEKGREVAHERMSPLLERLKSDPKTYAQISDLADPLLRTWSTATETLLNTKIEEVRSNYESQVNHLVSNSSRAVTTKFAYDGANPAKSKPDMIRMVEFAIDKEFDLEIEYVKANGSEVQEIIRPESLESDRLFAFCSSRKVHCAYRLERILSIKLE